MIHFTVHFQKGDRIGARQLRMVHVEAANPAHAIKAAKAEFKGEQAHGFKMIRVDHFDEEDDRLVIDW
jgi:hypothetical protein